MELKIKLGRKTAIGLVVIISLSLILLGFWICSGTPWSPETLHRWLIEYGNLLVELMKD